MRVGFDARLAHWPGIGRYILSVARLLACRTDMELVLYCNPEQIPLFAGLNARVQPMKAKPFSIQEQLEWAVRIPHDGLDLLHVPAYNVPVVSHCTLICTLHDMLYKRYPDHIGPVARMYYNLMHWVAVRRADRIVTVSQFSARELEEIYGIDSRKVTVVKNGVETGMDRTPAAGEAVVLRERYGMPDRYFLYVGTCKAHKNLSLTLKALRLCAEKGQPVPPLVLVGRTDQHARKVLALAGELGIADQVVHVGFVDELHLPAVYRGATAFVFPSLYEGFGLPIVEAMALGTPVITSGRGACAEVAGDAAVLVDPFDAEALAGRLVALSTEIQLREALIESGLRRAAEFTWDRAVAQLADMYGQTVKERRK